MKTKLFLLATLGTVVALTACKKEDPQLEPKEGVPAIMEVNLKGSEPTRAVGAPVIATETAIKKGVVFVFRGLGPDPALDAKATFDFTSTAVAPIRVNVTQGIRQVYVVANVVPADFAAINNLSDLQHITNKLSLDAFRTMGSLPMSGFVNNVDLTGTTSSPQPINVQLNFIGSRVHVDWDVTNLNPGLSGLAIQGAALLNVPEKSEYVPTSNGSGGYYALTHNLMGYLQGIGDVSAFTGSHLPSAGTVGTTNNADIELFVQNVNQGFDNNYTYVFENTSNKPIIVAFKGTYNGQTYYWPVVINGALNGVGGNNTGDGTATVKRGMIYKVKAIIKGLGVEDPYAPINPGAIDVTIVPASWEPAIQIDQEFL